VSTTLLDVDDATISESSGLPNIPLVLVGLNLLPWPMDAH
jgi:hypothetical protein